MANITSHLGMQIKTTVSYHMPADWLLPKGQQACGEKGTLEHHWWEVNSCSHCGQQYGSSSKNNNRSTIQSRNSNFGYLSLEIKSFILKMRNEDQRDAETLKSSTWT